MEYGIYEFYWAIWMTAQTSFSGKMRERTLIDTNKKFESVKDFIFLWTISKNGKFSRSSRPLHWNQLHRSCRYSIEKFRLCSSFDVTLRSHVLVLLTRLRYFTAGRSTHSHDSILTSNLSRSHSFPMAYAERRTSIESRETCASDASRFSAALCRWWRWIARKSKERTQTYYWIGSKKIDRSHLHALDVCMCIVLASNWKFKMQNATLPRSMNAFNIS